MGTVLENSDTEAVQGDARGCATPGVFQSFLGAVTRVGVWRTESVGAKKSRS